jgi:hypothetical protein
VKKICRRGGSQFKSLRVRVEERSTARGYEAVESLRVIISLSHYRGKKQRHLQGKDKSSHGAVMGGREEKVIDGLNG